MPPELARIKSVPVPRSISSILVIELRVSESFPDEPVILSVPSPPSTISPPFTEPLKLNVSSPSAPLNESAPVSAFITIKSS